MCVDFQGGEVVQKRESSDLRSPEVGISEIVLWAGYFSAILCHCDESVLESLIWLKKMCRICHN